MARLTDAQALKLIRESLGGRGRLTLLSHAEERMLGRGFTDSDLRHAIQNGRITRCEPDKYGEDRFTLEGPSAGDGRRERRLMGIVFKVITIDPAEAIVITVVDESARFGRRRPR